MGAEGSRGESARRFSRRRLGAVGVATVLGMGWVSATLITGCCNGDGRGLCETGLRELAELKQRAPATLQPAIEADRAGFARELAATPAADAGPAARRALSGRINVALADWDKRVDEALRVAALRPLTAGKWVGIFYENGLANLGRKVEIRADGSFSSTHRDRHYDKKRLRTSAGTILGVAGGTLTYKAAGRTNEPETFVADAPPRPLPPTNALGFLVDGVRFVQLGSP
jgi:hypothetical protein